MDDVNTQNANPGDGGDATQQQGGQTQTLGWKTELPEAMRGHEAFANYQTKNDLWNGHIELTGKIKDLEGRAANSIPKLGENATDEEKAAYRAAIGVPEKADDYEIELAEGMDNTLAPWFKGVAHQLGIPKEIAKGLSAAWNGMIAQMAKADKDAAIKAHDEALTELKRLWGPDAEKNAETVKQGYKFFGDNPVLNELLQAEITIGGRKVKVGNHPGMVNLILEIGKKVSPDSTVQGGPGHGQPVNNGIIQYDWNKTSGG